MVAMFVYCGGLWETESKADSSADVTDTYHPPLWEEDLVFLGAEHECFGGTYPALGHIPPDCEGRLTVYDQGFGWCD